MSVKLIVTREKFDEVFSVEDWFNFNELTNKDMYDKMIHFVADDEGNILTPEDARKKFKEVPRKEWGMCVAEFYKAVHEAFVNPTNGNG